MQTLRTINCMTRNSQAKKIADGDITAATAPAPRPWLAPAWQPGQSGNPAGRPRGARSKLSELTLNKLLADFEIHGDTVITEVRSKNPTAYLAAVVSLLPKQQEKLDSPFSDLTENELDLLERFLKSTRAHNVTTIDAEPIADAPVATSNTQESSLNGKTDT